MPGTSLAATVKLHETGTAPARPAGCSAGRDADGLALPRTAARAGSSPPSPCERATSRPAWTPVREPRTTRSESAGAGAPSRLIWVAAEASRLAGAGETVRRPPASADDTFELRRAHAGHAAGAQPPRRAPRRRARRRRHASSDQRTTARAPPRRDPRPAPRRRDPAAPLSALDGRRGADQRPGGVERLHGDVRARGGGTAIVVSKPLLGAVAAAASEAAVAPASTRQLATSVAPFQLADTDSVPAEPGRTATPGSLHRGRSREPGRS